MNIFESINSTLYRVAPLEVEETTDVGEVINNVSQRGGSITYIDDDMFVATCNSQSALEDITDYLDDNDDVDEYDVSVYESTGNGAFSKLDTDYIDIETISNFNNLRIEIIIFLNTDNVDYGEYYDIDDDELTERFGQTNKKQPVWLALSSSEMVLEEGSYIVTPHPGSPNTLLVHAEYKYDETQTDFIAENAIKIKDDINTINEGHVYHDLHRLGYVLDESISLDFSVESSKDGHFVTPPAVFVKEKGNVNLVDIMESFNDTTLFAETGIINEVKRIVKVNFKGKKRIKMKCLPGYKFDVTRRACVKIGGSEKADDRRAKIKMTRTKKSKGSGLKRATARKTKKAKRFRKLMGI